MSYSNVASTIHLGSGQILFGDPTKSWDPTQLELNPPVFPSTNLIIAASGRVEDQTFSQLTFPNQINYEPFEPPTIRSTLIKTMVADIFGNVSFATPKVSALSTFNSAYSESVNSFATADIGGPDINNTTNPDTITNALGKLDSWITNTFLLQPPCVMAVSTVSSSVYGAIQWNNFVTYNILNTFAPYVASIAFVIGDPTTADYVTLEYSGQDYFPFKNYITGISPVKTPLVRVRLFTDFFPKTGSKSYTKQTMQNNCMALIKESGSYVLPSRGKVFSIEDTNHISSFTTFNFFIPNLPKDTPVPISISYTNNTIPSPNICAFSTVLTSQGPPSVPTNVYVSTATSNCITYSISPPVYSDAQNSVTEQYFSTYTIQYAWNQMNTVCSPDKGFVYGTPNPQTLPDFLSTYTNTYTTTVPAYSKVLNLEQENYIPGAVFLTSVSATNSAGKIGPYSQSIHASTNFTTTRTSTLQNVVLIPNGPGLFNPNTLYEVVLTTDGWRVSTLVSSSVFFLSSPTNVPLIASIPAQLNNQSYPGDRNPITFTYFHKDVNTYTRSFDYSISISSGTNDYSLQSTYSYTNAGGDVIQATLSETNPTLGYSHYFYNVLLSGGPIISSINTQAQTVYFALQNTALINCIETQSTATSATYSFSTEPFNTFSYDQAQYVSSCANVVYISGMPTAHGQLLWNANVTNQLSMYALSTIGFASLRDEMTTVTPNTNITSSLIVVNPNTNMQVTTTPWPNNTSLLYSSLTVNLTDQIYQDVDCPMPFFIDTSFINPYPSTTQSISIPLTSNFFIDTESAAALPSFQDPTQPFGQHIQSFLPRTDYATTSNDMGDGVDCYGLTSNGLDVQYSSFIFLTSSTTFFSTTMNYDNTSNLAAEYPNTYGRELMFLQGHWLHPALYDFTPFDANYYCISNPVYSDFSYDLAYDENQGFRYATFLYTSTLQTHTPYTSIEVTINDTNFVGSMTTTTDNNTFFPDAPIHSAYLQFSKVKLHVKHFATFDGCGSETMETEWINGLKQEGPHFSDSTYDEGGCVNVSTMVLNSISSITYTILMEPRYYSNIATLVRVGIASVRETVSGQPLKFQNVTINYKS